LTRRLIALVDKGLNVHDTILFARILDLRFVPGANGAPGRWHYRVEFVHQDFTSRAFYSNSIDDAVHGANVYFANDADVKRAKKLLAAAGYGVSATRVHVRPLTSFCFAGFALSRSSRRRPSSTRTSMLSPRLPQSQSCR
jgi:hypothetical protein